MTLHFSCRNVGVSDCRHTASADSAEALLEAVADHARTAHGVDLNDTLIDYALTTVTES